MFSIVKKYSLIGLGLYCFLLTVPASAQLVLEEIIVTATKRQESLQDIPISIIATSGVKLNEMNLRNPVDMADFTPNLVMTDAFQGVSTFIRGNGTFGGNPAFEPSVATFIDGSYLGRDSTTRSAFLDVNRVEIVRGPQPLFAGQNAVAGALNIISKRPSDKWEGFARVSAGSDEEYSLEAAYGGPVTDRFGFRIAAIYDDRGGWVDNPATGIKGRETEDKQVRATFVFEPTDRLSITAIATAYEAHGNGAIGEYASCAPTEVDRGYNFCESNPENIINDVTYSGGAVGTPLDLATAAGAPAPFPFSLFGLPGIVIGGTNVLPGGAFSTDAQIVGYGPRATEFTELREQEGSRFNLILDYESDGFTFMSQTNYIEYDDVNLPDPDASLLAYFHVPVYGEYEVKQQEFRISSTETSPFEWMAGLYYQESEFVNDNPGTLVGIDTRLLGQTVGGLDYRAAPPFPADTYFNEEAEWLSAYVNFGFQLTEKLKIEVGARYTEIEKEGSMQNGTGFFEVNDDGVITALVASNNGPGCAVGTDVRGNPAPPTFAELPVCVADEVDNNSVDPQVVATYDANDDTMVFARYAKGFKAGGFSVGMSVAAVEDFAYEPEEAETFEAGVKSTLMDGRLELNATVFYTEFENLQVSAAAPDGSASAEEFIIQNAAESSSYGLEFDGRWAASERFMLNFAGAFLTSEYDSYPTAACNGYKIARDQDGCASNSFFEAAGKNTNGANPWSFVLGGRYEIPLSSGYQLAYSADLDLTKYDPENDFTGRVEPEFQNDVEERLNVRVSLSPNDARWEVAVYADNVTDNRRFTSFPGSLSYGEDIIVTRTQGATFGAQMRYNFGN